MNTYPHQNTQQPPTAYTPNHTRNHAHCDTDAYAPDIPDRPLLPLIRDRTRDKNHRALGPIWTLDPCIAPTPLQHRLGRLKRDATRGRTRMGSRFACQTRHPEAAHDTIQTQSSCGLSAIFVPFGAVRWRRGREVVGYSGVVVWCSCSGVQQQNKQNKSMVVCLGYAWA